MNTAECPTTVATDNKTITGFSPFGQPTQATPHETVHFAPTPSPTHASFRFSVLNKLGARPSQGLALDTNRAFRAGMRLPHPPQLGSDRTQKNNQFASTHTRHYTYLFQNLVEHSALLLREEPSTPCPTCGLPMSSAHTTAATSVAGIRTRLGRCRACSLARNTRIGPRIVLVAHKHLFIAQRELSFFVRLLCIGMRTGTQQLCRVIMVDVRQRQRKRVSRRWGGEVIHERSESCRRCRRLSHLVPVQLVVVGVERDSGWRAEGDTGKWFFSVGPAG